MPKFQITYDIVTPESAEDGDTAESGFVLPGNWHIDIDTAMADKEGNYSMSLREAVDLLGNGYIHNNRDGSFYNESSDTDYSTGAEETRALHAGRAITQSSMNRLARLLGAY